VATVTLLALFACLAGMALVADDAWDALITFLAGRSLSAVLSIVT